MSEIVIDEIDRAIINLLQSNARLSAVDIAAHLDNISPRIVRYRIEKLSQAGIISFTTVINSKALNFPIQAIIFLKCESAQILNVVRQLTQIEMVTGASVVTGDQDIIVSVVAKTIEDLNNFLSKEIQHLHGVHQTQTHLVLEVYKNIYQWKIPEGIENL
jgi:Lrp/AsnC family transcriptional regulator for asnA, asnC and gidA